MARRLGKEKNSENLAGTQARCCYISGISEGQYGYGRHSTVKTSMRSGKTSDMVFLDELKPSDVLQKNAKTRTATATPLQILSSQGLQGLWMFGETRQAMGVHLRSTSHGGHGY
ncbi:hypothetical protein HO173_009303 [Letharia columbiana]|uniref:Uncharacterized protein n=1 Tax=Letharia columbiana TaxID=112416 RepID=A0A8H6FPP8_9LECA|nr:uncharacterized protein HO173_009303 [Letharia columbiana]KAF6232424.1 hypothetical protein HO173_009303 [Letharia columbiana]